MVSKGLFGRWETEEGVRKIMILMMIEMMVVKMVGDGGYDDVGVMTVVINYG